MGLKLFEPFDKADVLTLLPVAKLKSMQRIGYNTEDDILEDCILAAYGWLAGEKGWLNRSVLPMTWQATESAFSDPITLARGPSISVSSIQYRVSGVYTTVATSVYELRPGDASNADTIYLKSGQSWPTDGDSAFDAVRINYVTGLGDDASDIRDKYPEIVRGLAILAGDYFRHREDSSVEARVTEIDRRIVNHVRIVCGRHRYWDDFA